MSQVEHLRLFQGYGIEAEYMIVDRETLAVRPIADELLAAVAGGIVNEVELGDTAWSNELVMHVVEIKTNGPTADLAGVAARFQRDINRINGLLAAKGAMLMPTAMHPTMDPMTDVKLWPHDNAEIYDAYNRIFDCRGHGWSNLQSVHINLPFYDDAEFGRLHAAVRLVLPILPALAASSPIYGGQVSGFADSRLEFYRHNQKRVPEITGGVIPEPAYTRRAYEDLIFAKIYAAIAPHDPAKILQDEWLNSRGAIARFDRHAIEIRLMDIQESPRMDLAVVTTVVSLVQALAEERWAGLAQMQAWESARLRPLFEACVREGGKARIEDRAFLKLFGQSASVMTTADLWRRLVDDLSRSRYPLTAHLDDIAVICARGNLSERLVAATGPKPSRERLRAVYGHLCAILAEGGVFDGREQAEG